MVKNITNLIKSLFILSVFLLLCIPAEGAYIEKFPMEVKQPDGTVLNCFATGDEFYNWLHDKDGYTIIQNRETGWYVYGEKKDGRIIPSTFVAGVANPANLGIKPWLIADAKIIREDNREFLRTRHMTPPKIKDHDKPLTISGSLNNLVVYIRFSDDPEFTDNTSTYDNMFNTTGQNSMKDYFLEATYNQLNVNSYFYPTPSGSIVVSFQDNQPRGYYQPYSSTNTIGYTGGDNGSQRRDREHILLRNAINSISSQVQPTIDIDYDNDGYVDNVCFIVYGSPTAWATLLWPHMWSLYSQTASINGSRVWNYNFQIRSHLLSNGNGVLCHEMYHTLGSPDLYHYSYDGLQPVYRWDLMENNANPPQHMGAYMKWKYGGWITSMPEITTAGTYTLNPLTSSTNNCYKIASPRSSSEFFVVEYRKKTGRYENSVPGSGLIIYRINPAYEGNADGPPDEVYIYRPNGTTTANGTPASANYSVETGRIAINNATNPKAFLSNGSDSDLNIDQISSAGNTITFRVNFAVTGRPQLTSPPSGSVEVVLAPTLQWQSYAGANSYILEVSELSDFSTTVVNLTDFTPTSYTIPADLKMYTRYYWRVKAKVGSIFTEWSDVWTFTTARGIITNGVTGVFCAESIVNIDFNASNIFQSGNTYIAQLSDTSGRFNFPTNIGVFGSNEAGDLSISALLPDTLPTGYNYKFRVIATSPAVNGSPTVAGYLIISKLDPVISDLSDTACIEYVHRYYTSDLSYLQYNWTILGGNILGPSNKPWVDVVWDKLGKCWLKVEQTATTGCNASTLKNVEVITLPVASFDKADTVVCQGGSGFYYANDDGKMLTEFKIIGGKLETKYSMYNMKVKWDSLGTGKIILIQYNAGGCPDTVIVNVRIIPAPAASFTGANNICGLSMTVYHTTLKGTESCKWTVTNGTIIGADNQKDVSVKWNEKGAANVTLTVTDNVTKCDDIQQMDVILTPNVKAVIYGKQTACSGRDMSYYYQENASDSIVTWYFNGVESGIASDTAVFNFTNAGNNKISLLRLNKNGCSDSSDMIVLVYETPPPPSIEQRSDSIFSNAPKGNVWFYNDEEISGEYSSFIVPKKSGNYSAKVDNEHLCRSDMSNYLNFVVGDVKDLTDDILVYPTITNSGINVTFKSVLTADVRLLIYNSIGNTVIERELSNDNGNSEYVDLLGMPQGYYMLQIQYGTRFYITKIMLIK